MNNTARPITPECIPAELRAKPQWLTWRLEFVNERWTKVPYQTDGHYADSTKPATWTDFDSAWGAACDPEKRFSGIGFAVTDQDEFCGLDLDGCRDEHGTIPAEAMAIVERLKSYTEITPSETGLRIWVKGRLPDRCRNSTSKVGGFKKIEFYDRVRYFTMTGWHLDGTPTTIESRQDELLALHAEIFPAVPKPAPAAPDRVNGTAHRATGFLGSDDKLIDAARTAANGPKFSGLFDRGDTSAYGGDDSAADLGLCDLLAFWCGPDPARIDRLFGRSKLVREKWLNRADYRQMTIARSLEGRTEFYVAGRPAASSEIPAIPVLSGPGDLQLVAAEARTTPTRTTVRFEVTVKGEVLGDLQGSNTPTAVKKAGDTLCAMVGAAGVPDEAAALRKFVGEALSSRSVASIAKQLDKRAAALAAAQPADTTPSMLDIVKQYYQETLAPAFLEDTTRGRSIWSEKEGRLLTQAECRGFRSSELLERASAARDYAAPTDSDPTKPHKHLIWVSDGAWSDIVQGLTDEAGNMSLGRDSKAAARFAAQMRRLWLTPETWMKEGGRLTTEHKGSGEIVQRMSLGSRAREMASHRPKPGWHRVLQAVNVYYAVDGTGGRIWLAMREDACQHAVKGVMFPGVKDRASFETLLSRYGLVAPADVVPAALAARAAARGLQVLHPDLSQFVLADADDTPGAIEPGGRCGTSVDAVTLRRPSVDHATGEVLHD